MINKPYIYFAAFAFLLLFSSCKDECKSLNCVNGECVDGFCDCDEGWGGTKCEVADACAPECVNGDCLGTKCICNPGWEGSVCDRRMTNKFVGQYQVNESCNSGNFTYFLFITESAASIDVIFFSNFYDLNFQGVFDPVFAVVTNSVDITIPSQFVGGWQFSGTGTLDTLNNILTVQFDANDGSGPDFCSTNMHLQ